MFPTSTVRKQKIQFLEDAEGKTKRGLPKTETGMSCVVLVKTDNLETQTLKSREA